MKTGVNDIIWTYGPNDRVLLEDLYPPGTVVDIFGSERAGIVLGNLRLLYEKGSIDSCDGANHRWFLDVLVGNEKKAISPWMLIKKDPKNIDEESVWSD